jgi:hypothetical protein
MRRRHEHAYSYSYYSYYCSYYHANYLKLGMRREQRALAFDTRYQPVQIEFLYMYGAWGQAVTLWCRRRAGARKR